MFIINSVYYYYYQHYYYYFYYKGYLEEKAKATGWEGGFLLIKQCGHVHMHVIFVLNVFSFFGLFCFLIVSCKTFLCFLEFNNCVCKFKNLLKKR